MLLKTLIKNYIEIIKEHYNAIALIPILLGGIRQIMELANIGIGYIRYFSVTQLIPDGMTVIFIMGGILSLWTIGKVVFQENKEKTEDEKLSTEDNILVIFGIVVVYAISAIVLYNILQSTGLYKQISNRDIHILKSHKILFISIFILIISLSLKLIQILLHKVVKLIKKRKRGYNIIEYMKKDIFTTEDEDIYGLIYLCAIIACMRFINTLSTTYPRLHKDMGTIKYMNDKYIFFEVTNNSGTFIEIRPFEELFTSNSSTNSGHITSTH